MYDMNKIFTAVITAAVLVFGALNSYGRDNAATMTVGTYNIRIVNAQDSVDGNGWERRLPRIADVIRFHGFDIFGSQEGLRSALDDLKGQLHGYEYIGVGCDNGADAGGHNAIFYDTDKFELMDEGTFWLSETPDTVSFGWDAAYRRVCTWGKFRHKDADFTFMFFNLHTDHIGTTARVESAKLILKKIRELNGQFPVILSGDFNDDQESECYGLVNASGLVKDAFDAAGLRYITSSTFNNFNPGGSYLTESGDFQRINHIFLSSDFDVKKYGVLGDTYLTVDDPGSFTVRVPSDHYPVMVVVGL